MRVGGMGGGAIELAVDGFELRLGRRGAVITRLIWSSDGMAVPILREAPPGAAAAQASCFPLVPVGNRVRGNRFSFEEQSYHLEPNTPSDPHYLHGDGWLATWEILRRDERSAELRLLHAASAANPHADEARRIVPHRAGSGAIVALRPQSRRVRDAVWPRLPPFCR